MLAAGSAGSLFAKHFLGVKTKKVEITKTPTPTVSPKKTTTTPTPTKTPTQAISPKPTLSKTGSISLHIGDGSIPDCRGINGKDCLDPNLDNPINDESMEFVIKREPDGEEIKTKKPVSDWSVKDLAPGKYKAFVSYSFLKYRHRTASCAGCFDYTWFDHEDTCGYILDLRAGDNVRISCKFENSKAYIGPPLPTDGPPPKGPDTTAPITNIFYPGNGGSIDYKTDGKVCAYMSAPTEETKEGLTTYFKFDDGAWIPSVGTGYLCSDNLSNGSHTLSYYSKDQNGNTESTRTISFSVNIPAN